MGVTRTTYGNERGVDDKLASQNSWKISEIVNPDGSVTVRRVVRHPDGSRTVEEDEYSGGEEPVPRGRPRARQPLGDSSFIPSDQSDTSGDHTEESEHLPSYRRYHESGRHSFKSLEKSDDSTASSSNRRPILRGISPPRNRPIVVPKSRKAAVHFNTEDNIDISPPRHYVGENDSFTKSDSDGGSEEMVQPQETKSAMKEKAKPNLQLLYDRDRGHFVTIPVNSTDAREEQVEGNISSGRRREEPELVVPPILTPIPRRSEMKSIVDTDLSIYSQSVATMATQSHHYTVKVFKRSNLDKIGVHVGLRRTIGGRRLIVSKISPTGLVANSPMQPGDVVVAINGYNFLENPDSHRALGKFPTPNTCRLGGVVLCSGVRFSYLRI